MMPSAQRVLLVDEGPEDAPVVDEIASALEAAGFSVRRAVPGESAGDIAARFRPDVAVISLTSAVAGAAAAAAVRRELESDHGIPVVVVEAHAPPVHPVRPEGPGSGVERVERVERVEGEPAVARLRSVLQENPRPSPTLEAGDLVVDETARVALRADQPLAVTRLEFDLLAYFVRNRNRVLTRESLQAAVWLNVAVTPNAIEAVVSKLRTKLEEHGARQIHTVRGVGYVLRIEGTSPFDHRHPGRTAGPVPDARL